jgi:hypothetical protein
VSDFTVAAPDERTLSVGEYLLGALVVAAIVGPLAWAAWRVRASVLPGWSGPPARVAEVVLGISGLIVLAQLLGTFGAFAAAPMVIGALAVAAAAAAACARLDRRSPSSPPVPSAPPAGSAAVTLVAIACAALAAAWAVPTLISIAGGMGRADTLWYHMPLSARFVQTGSVGEIFHFDPIFLAAYYPANSSVLHAVPILGFERDIVSPVLNLGFLALGLLSAWSIGRPYGLAPHALIGGSIALGAQMLIEFQGGQALDDIVGTAFILAAAAVLVNGSAASATDPPPAGPARRRERRPAILASVGPLTAGALAVAGLAAGLAAGTKLSFLPPTGALFVALVVVAGRGARIRAAAWFALPALLAGGYWYVRNLVAVGNPIPFVSSLGPIDLPSPERAFQLRPGFSVSHYWNDPGVWSEWFFPGLAESFGALWPVTLAAMIGAGAFALWRGPEPILRVLGAMVVVTAVAYVFTPLTAAGEEGEPISFVWNVRYIAPAAAVGLAMLPCLPVLRATPWRREVSLVLLSGLLAVTVASLVQWQQGHTRGAIAAGVATLVAFGLVGWLRSMSRLGRGAPRRWAVGLVCLVLAGGLAGGWWLQDHYLERRYQNLSPQLRLAEAVRFGGDLRDARVAMAGVRGVFNQYPFYGTDLSNHVQWLGIEDEDGAFLRIPTCAAWREALTRGDYTHVVTMYDPFDPGPLTDTKESLWTREDPAAREVLRDGPVSVFELTGPPSPGECGDLPHLSRAERTGDSVNRKPTANQPDYKPEDAGDDHDH